MADLSLGWTVTNAYFATGEGITTWLMYSFTGTREDALAAYAKRVSPYFGAGASVKAGIDMDCPEAKVLLSATVRRMIEDGDFGNASFFAEVHVNYN